ncbi:MAG: A/G-specific adenine glycosylase [Bacteroidales bacterium]|jgi:A/G-specific adenine glycosylase|nr:A/G-specific adenine glycosylase [Bacteroidales bacterium]
MTGEILIYWYERNKRDLPWRNTQNPYLIWVSEIILQQTRVMQGMDYFHRFIDRFPDIFSLAQAEIDEVLKIWQGLGYYSRARNMHEAANYIVAKCGGNFPDTCSGLLKIKGIGDYTAAAIASFAFGESVPVIDGNVNRVISRLYDIREPIDTLKGKQQIRHWAEKTMAALSPGIYNQAIMEFGALQCVPHGVHCEECVLRTFCKACIAGVVDLLPLKSKKVQIKTRYFHYIMVCDAGDIFLRRRGKGDIWNGLYEFPLIETEMPSGLEELRATRQWQQWFGSQIPHISFMSGEITRQLTHRTLKVRFYGIKDCRPAFDEQFIRVKKENIRKYAVPKVIEDCLEKLSGWDT